MLSAETLLPPLMLTVSFLLSPPRRRAAAAADRQSAQLPAVLPLPLPAAAHPGRSQGPRAPGPPPVSPGGHQGAAQRQSHVLQGHLQPPDAGEQRLLLLAIQ